MADEAERLLEAPAAPRRSIWACLRPPHEIFVRLDESGWVETASRSLSHHGLVVLRQSPQAPPLIPGSIVERCRSAARPLLDRYLGLADRSGVADAPLQFLELYSRAPWENRFDLSVLRRPAHPVAASGCSARDAYAALLGAVDRLVRPLLRASRLFGAEAAEVEAVGCVLSLPGAPSQAWHPDSEHQVGLLNVFVPLVALSSANGPTSLELGSHTGRRRCCRRVVNPQLAAGELVLFDWRTWHRGGANRSDAERPVAYITYARVGVEGASYKLTLPSLDAWESVWGGGDSGRFGGSAERNAAGGNDAVAEDGGESSDGSVWDMDGAVDVFDG